MLYYPQVTHLVGGNTAGNNTTIYSGTYFLAGGNNITLSQSQKTITISQGGPVFNFYQNQEGGNSATLPTVPGVLSVYPFDVGENIFGGDMTAQTLLLNMSGLTGSTVTGAVTNTLSVGIYTIGSSSRISLINSATTTWGQTANTGNTQSYFGLRWLSLNSSLFSTSLTFSRTNYILGLLMNFGATSRSLAQVGQLFFASNFRSGTMGAASTNTNTLGWGLPFYGIYTTTTNGLPGTIGNNQLIKAGTGGPASLGNPSFMQHFVLNNLTNTI